MRVSSVIFLLAALPAIGATNVPAEAGQITAKANITYCEVQAVDCIESDLQSCNLIFNSALAPGEAIISQTGSLCYRRNKNPGDCASVLQSDWSCITNFVDEPKKYEIR